MNSTLMSLGGRVCVCGGRSIYLRMGVKKTPTEFVDDGDIFGGARTSPCVTLDSNNYEGGFGIFLSYCAWRNKWANRLRWANNSKYALNWAN